MGRWFIGFVMGVVIGGVTVFGSLKYHIVKSAKGLELVPKIQPTFADTYIDVTAFGPAEWAQHPALGLALMHADRRELFADGAERALGDRASDAVNELKRALGQ